MAEAFYTKFTEKKSKSGKKDRKSEKPQSKKADFKPNAPKIEITSKSEKAVRPAPQPKVSAAPYKVLCSQFAEDKLPKDSLYILNNFDEIIQGVKPLNSRQLQQLPDNIRNLSHQLTDDRASRRLGYMNDNIQLSSYVRYYTWWNLVRLTRLFSNIDSSVFPNKECVCLDLGSGPLTVVTALWLARPELRSLPLTWYCLDVSGNSLALGEDIFLSIAARTGSSNGTEGTDPWKIIRVKGPFGTSIKQKADFITCANMLNELDQASDMPPEFQSKKYFDQLTAYGTKDVNFLLVEPGVPKASRTLSLLRGRFLDAGKTVLAPCPHAVECPMNGFKAYTGSQNKWCNFAFSTESAPARLQKLSEAAKLPKERATLCFVTAVSGKKEISKSDDLLCRVASDPFRLPGNNTGFYACSKLGLTLLKGRNLTLKSGDLISVKIKTPDSLPKDEKSGALIINL